VFKKRKGKTRVLSTLYYSNREEGGGGKKRKAFKLHTSWRGGKRLNVEKREGSPLF